MINDVEIIEVGPRDGFQNVSEFIPTETKLDIIDGIVQSGIKNIQITSFVHPKAIPQMKDAKEIVSTCIEKYPDINFFALVPNMKGADLAVSSGLKELTYVISVSETHNLKNVKRTHDESFGELEKLIQKYPNIKINLDVATTFGCHYEGETSLSNVMSFLERAYKIGVTSFNLCDTVGMADPSQIKKVVNEVLSEYKNCEIQVHIHDTRNMGMINSYTAMECGVNKIQTAIGGLGGCPFAPGASGNTSTEDFVYMINNMGFNTGIDKEKLIDTAKNAKSKIQGNFSGHHIFINKDKVSNQ